VCFKLRKCAKSLESVQNIEKVRESCLLLSKIQMTSLTALNFDRAVLRVERVVVEVHHAGQGRREPHAVGDGSVAVKPDHLVLFRYVVEETEM
jgi:hypothetical protein